MSTPLPSINEVAAQFKAAPAPEPLAVADAPKPEAIVPAAEPTTTSVETPQTVPPPSKEEKALDQAEATAPAPETKPDPTASKFAALSKRERAAREAEQRIKDSEARVQQMLEQAEARMKAAEEREKALNEAKRPLEVLRAKGWKYQDVTEDYLTGGDVKEPEPDPFAERLKPIQERLAKYDELEKRFNEREQQVQEREFNVNLQTVNSTIETTLKADPDRYEYTLKFGAEAIDSVRETMVQYAQANPGKPLLTYAEAADRVEEYWENVSNTLQATKKLASRFQAPAQAAKPTQAPQPAPTPKETKPTTLTQDLAAGSATDAVDLNKLPKHEALRLLAKQIKFIAD